MTKPVLAVVAGEPFGNAFDRLSEPPFAAQPGLLGAPQWRDVVQPAQPLGPRDRNVAAMIGNLHVRDQHIEQLTVLGLPDHLFVEQLSALNPKPFDNTIPLSQVVPEASGVEQLQLILVVAGQMAQPAVVEQQPTLFVDNVY